MIFVRVPTVAGTVTDVTSTGFTVKLRDGSSKTVTTSSSTSFLLGDAKSSKSDLSVGARVSVEGTDGSSFAADVVHIVPDLRIGKVTAVTSSSITIQGRNNTTVTIHVDASTTYRVKGAARRQALRRDGRDVRLGPGPVAGRRLPGRDDGPGRRAPRVPRSCRSSPTRAPLRADRPPVPTIRDGRGWTDDDARHRHSSTLTPSVGRT